MHGQSHFNACFLLFFYLPGTLLKDELYHHFIWEALWQLSGLLTLLLPQCSSAPSALLASSSSLSSLSKLKALLKHFGEPQLLKSHKHKLVIWQRILFLPRWRNQPFSISTYGCSICSRACLQCTWQQEAWLPDELALSYPCCYPWNISTHKWRNTARGKKKPKQSGARENTLMGFLFNYMPAFLAYSTMLKKNTTDGGWVLKAHWTLKFC